MRMAALIALWLSLAAPAAAQTLDDALGGFEEPSASAVEAPRAAPSWFEGSGSLKLSGAYAVAHGAPGPGQPDWRGLNRLRARADIAVEARPGERWRIKVGGKGLYDFAYAIKGRDEFTSAVLDEYESELELREAFVQGKLAESLDLTVGRQIVAWGKMDNLRVTDVLNALDNREPGMVDIEDLREPLAMSKLDYYRGGWNLSLVAIHEIRFNKTAPFGGEFYTLPIAQPREETPASSLENTEFAAALNGVFSGYDVSFYAASLYNDGPHGERTGAAPVMRHARLFMLGGAGAWVYGSWLIKAEAAWLDGLKFLNTPGVQFRRLDAAVGLEYAGITDHTFSFEGAARRLIGYDAALGGAPELAEETEWQTALRWQADFIHSTLHTITLAGYTRGGRSWAFERLQVTYDVSDTMKITGGAVAYQSEKSAWFTGFEENDRLFLEGEYNF
ncbi:MAG: ligand-binding protein SH3 [Nitrospinae bacterium]|nr:ligand-binding protein SH3 [Nitrospinota bacterium]